MSTENLLAFLGLFFTVLSSSIGVAVWITTRLTKLETKMNNAFTRIKKLEDAIEPPPRMRHMNGLGLEHETH